ncbi:cupin domain-containing protein [Anoxybacteroides amylolyticum]|uniref:Phosphohexomutase n=1 Tax=Anoxybacteroides amylolyticum TaxID=294699 RepID=A0A167T680_9BACL|nr:hypothetical protein [Anoxybacillus amylolyticus]ANB59510.1 putative mannose-6-phosphate isomerase yvyI domain protein [Anoxybacillus amylolyticus]
MPHIDAQCECQAAKTDGAEIATFIDNEYFLMQNWDITKEWEVEQTTCFLLASVIAGEGGLCTATETYLLQKGNHFLLAYPFIHFAIKGKLQVIVSSPAWPKQ